MTNVLVTGANGQLGSCIKDISNNHPNINFTFTDYKTLDICNEKAVIDFFNSHNPIHYCINCAAYTAVDKAELEVKKAKSINELAVKNLAEACKNKESVLIHVSTDFVFDGTQSIPYKESDETNPTSVYGKTKLDGELALKKVLESYFIIRTSWLYSENGNNFFKTMLNLSKTKKELNVVFDQVGSPTYAGDLASFMLKLIEESRNKYGIYHYSNEGVASWYDFTKAIFEEKGIKIKVNAIKSEAFKSKVKRPNFSVFDKTKIKETFSICTPYWRDSLKKAIEKYDEN